MYKDDIFKFLKDKFWKLLLTIILLTVLIFAALTFVLQRRSNNVRNTIINEENSAYSFELFLVNEHRSALNFRLLTKILNNQEHKQELETYLNKPIKNLDIKPEILENIEIADLNVIEAELISDTSTILFKVDLSKDSKENQEIAEFYYDKLTNKANPLFKHLNVYTVNPVEHYDPLNQQAIENKQMLGASYKIKTAIKVLLASIVLSFVIVSLLVYIKEFLSKKLRYPTTYYGGKPENLFYVPGQNQLRKLDLYLQKINASTKLALVEYKLDDESRKLFGKYGIKVLEESLLSALEDNDSEPIESVILLVQNNETARSWYNEQIETASDLNLQVYNIHLN